jgi:predicted Zn-dependent peptidase
MILDRKTAPQIKEITNFNLVKAEQLLFSNGLPVYFINTGDSDLIKVEWMFAAGNWYQTLPLVAFTVNNTLIEGTKKFKSREIAEITEYYGATLGYNVDKDNAYISIVTLRKHLPKVLEVVDEILKNAIFPEHELDIFIQKHRQQFLIDQGKVSSVARNNHARVLFGNHHPYGYHVQERDFGSISRLSLTEFYKTNYHSGNCRIIASGKVTDAELKVLSNFFGEAAWGMPNSNYSPRFLPETENSHTLFVEKPDAVQNAIRIGKLIGNKLHRDYVGLSVLNCILGGYFGSRLMKKIREEKGYTYGISSLLVSLVNSGFLTIVTEVGAEVTKQALQDIYVEMERLRNEPVNPDELNRVKNYMLGEIVRMFDGPFAQAESLISLLEYNLDYNYFDILTNTIRTITADQLLSLAQKYLAPETFRQVVVGKSF